MRGIASHFLQEAPWEAPRSPSSSAQIYWFLLGRRRSSCSHHYPGAASQDRCALTGLSLSAWVPKRLSSLGVGRTQGALEEFEDVALHYLLHCGRRWEAV